MSASTTQRHEEDGRCSNAQHTRDRMVCMYGVKRKREGSYVCTELSHCFQGCVKQSYRVAQVLNMLLRRDGVPRRSTPKTLLYLLSFYWGLRMVWHDDRYSHMPPPAVGDSAQLMHLGTWIPTKRCCIESVATSVVAAIRESSTEMFSTFTWAKWGRSK